MCWGQGGNSQSPTAGRAELSGLVSSLVKQIFTRYAPEVGGSPKPVPGKTLCIISGLK